MQCRSKVVGGPRYFTCYSFLLVSAKCDAFGASSCYILVRDTLDAAGARSKCLQYGGHLAVVDDAAENSLIHKLAEG